MLLLTLSVHAGEGYWRERASETSRNEMDKIDDRIDVWRLVSSFDATVGSTVHVLERVRYGRHTSVGEKDKGERKER